jgi:hypothetical protein
MEGTDPVSQAEIDRLVTELPQNSGLRAQLGAPGLSFDQVLRLLQEAGYKIDAEAQARLPGLLEAQRAELSDAQLDGVAGGYAHAL